MLLTGVGVVSHVRATASSNGFVTRSGDTLRLGGRQFRFSGTNIYWGGLEDDGRIGLSYPTPFRVQSALQTAADMGETVVRCQTCGISTGTQFSVEPDLGDFSQTALQHIDYFIAQAQQYGMKVVIPLTDNYRYYVGSYCDFTDWLGLAAPSSCPSAAAASAFYTSPKAIAAYEKYIVVLLNHVNYYTGVRNKDNPTIMAWETGNEMPYGQGGQAELTKWTATISAYIKSQDSRQLVMDGSAYLDRGDLALPTIDVVDTHCYPANPSWLTADAIAAATAKMPLVVGEFAWNDTAHLDAFLATVEQTPAVAGDMYWDQQPLNDFFGWVEHFDGYQLHYPGDNTDVNDFGGEPVLASSNDTADVTALRDHGYAMSGQSEPAYPVPAAPVMTSVEHVASQTAGTGNLLEWRGTPEAASYRAQRSSGGPGGPWTTVATVSAGDTEAPYLDGGAVAGPNLWYRVTGVNPAGVSGPPSSAYRFTGQTLDDNLGGLSTAISHDTGVTLGTSNSWQFGGDTSRAAFGPASQSQTIAWSAPGLTGFEALGYYDSAKTTHFTFQVSANDRTWTGVPAANVQANQLAGTASLDQLSYVYTIANVQRILPGASFVRVLRTGGSHGVAELGEVRITYP